MVENIYVGILQDNFKFKDVAFVNKDNHAYYFKGCDKDNHVDIKVQIDSDNIEVWSKTVKARKWNMLNVYC